MNPLSHHNPHPTCVTLLPGVRIPRYESIRFPHHRVPRLLCPVSCLWSLGVPTDQDQQRQRQQWSRRPRTSRTNRSVSYPDNLPLSSDTLLTDPNHLLYPFGSASPSSSDISPTITPFDGMGSSSSDIGRRSPVLATADPQAERERMFRDSVLDIIRSRSPLSSELDDDEPAPPTNLFTPLPRIQTQVDDDRDWGVSWLHRPSPHSPDLLPTSRFSPSAPPPSLPHNGFTLNAHPPVGRPVCTHRYSLLVSRNQITLCPTFP